MREYDGRMEDAKFVARLKAKSERLGQNQILEGTGYAALRPSPHDCHAQKAVVKRRKVKLATALFINP